MFSLECIMYHYVNLKEVYLKNPSKTRHKSIILPITKKTISDKNSYLEAIKIFNSLPTELKNLNLSKGNIKNKLKNYIKYK